MKISARALAVLSFVVVISLIAVLAWLTLVPGGDPCVDPQADISGSVLADKPGDQDALINRAIIMRKLCDKQGSGNADEEDRAESANDPKAK